MYDIKQVTNRVCVLVIGTRKVRSKTIFCGTYSLGVSFWIYQCSMACKGSRVRIRCKLWKRVKGGQSKECKERTATQSCRAWCSHTSSETSNVFHGADKNFVFGTWCILWIMRCCNVIMIWRDCEHGFLSGLLSVMWHYRKHCFLWDLLFMRCGVYKHCFLNKLF